MIDRRGSPSCMKAFICVPLRKKVFLLNYLRRPAVSLLYNLGLISMVEWPSHCLLEIVRIDQMTDFFILHDIAIVWYTPNPKGSYQRALRNSRYYQGAGIWFTVFSFVQILLSYPFIAVYIVSFTFLEYFGQWCLMSDFWVEHEFFVQGRGGNWTTWKQLE